MARNPSSRSISNCDRLFSHHLAQKKQSSLQQKVSNCPSANSKKWTNAVRIIIYAPSFTVFFLISCLNLLLLRWGRTRVVETQTFARWWVIKMATLARRPLSNVIPLKLLRPHGLIVQTITLIRSARKYIHSADRRTGCMRINKNHGLQST